MIESFHLLPVTRQAIATDQYISGLEYAANSKYWDSHIIE